MMKVSLTRIGALLVVTMIAASGTPAHAKKCPPDSVQVGTLCVDTYEASVWSIPATSTSLIKKVQKGKAVLADLTGGGGTQISPSSSCTPSFPGTFPANGQWTAPLYAVSIAGVHPTACVNVVPGRAGLRVAQPVRQRQHPLTHGQTTGDAVHQVRSHLGHAPAAARRAKAPPLAGKRDENLALAVLKAEGT